MAEQSSNFFGKLIDGASKQYGLKDGAQSGMVERIGGFASVIIPTIMLNDRFRVKPAIQALPENQRQQVVDAIPLGSFTIGKA